MDEQCKALKHMIQEEMGILSVILPSVEAPRGKERRRLPFCKPQNSVDLPMNSNLPWE
jgi:hypothetical protein